MIPFYLCFKKCSVIEGELLNEILFREDKLIESNYADSLSLTTPNEMISKNLKFGA